MRYYQQCLHQLGCPRLLPDRSENIEYHKVKYLRDAIDAIPVELITYGYLRHPELSEKIKVPEFVRKGLGGNSRFGFLLKRYFPSFHIALAFSAGLID